MSLIHWWPLNGNTTDLGISPCTVSGTPAFAANGKIGKCLSGGALTMPAVATAQAFNKDAVSVCFWLYNGGSSGCIFGTDPMTPPNNRRFTLFQWPTTNDLHWSWQNEDSGGVFVSGIANGAIPSNAWTHICAVWDNGTARIYANGTQVGMSPGTCTSTNWAYDTIIARPNNLRYYNDIRIYNHALSAKEVKEISKGLILHYNFEDEYIEPTTNLCNSITPAKYSGWGTIKATQIGTNSYGLKNTASNASQLSVWDSWGYDVSSYVGQTITFSATVKDIQFVNVNNNTSWIAIGQANSGQYPNHISSSGTGNFIQYVGSNSIVKGTRLTWTGIIQEPGRVLFELWTYASSAGGYIQLDLSEIQIEVKDHATPYVNGTRSTGKVYDNSGYGNNGTVNNSLQVIPGGLSGAHYINLPLASTITYTSEAFNKTELTYSIWFRHHGANGSNVTYMFTNGRADYGGLGYGIQIANDSQIVCRYGNSTETVSNCSKDVWHLITVSIKNAVQTIYLDGALVGSFTATVLPSYSDGKGLGLGCFYYHGGSIYHSNCDFADFKIYATALSADDIKVEYSRKAAIDKKGNLFTGEFIETNTNANIADKNNQIKATYFVEGKDTVKIFGGYTELDYFDQINPAAGATSQHNRCTISDISYDHIEARVNVTGQGRSGGIVFSNGMWWKTYTGQGNVNDGSGTVTMTPTSFSQNVWTDVSWDFSKVFSILWTSGWSDGINHWTPQNVKVAYIKTYIGSELTGYFIPVKNKNNVIGLFNLITNKFYSNTGTGTEGFVAGNSLGKLSLIQENKIEEL